MAAHVDVNVIVVGRDAFTQDQLQTVENAIARSQAIFALHGLPIGTVKRFHINLAQVGALVVPRNAADCRALTDRWAVPDNGLDVFVVPNMTDPQAIGRSPLYGSCAKRATKLGLRAPVVSLVGSDLDVGQTLTHELGHCLGLDHCDPAVCGPQNVMAKGARSGAGKFTTAQVEKMKRHCFVKP